jgi:two-component system CheB/CheR fusion protein
MNVRVGDIGRPITDITSNFIDVLILVQTIKEVLDTAVAYENEIQDSNGHWHQLRVRPYKTQDSKLDGVVVTLFDIDQFKARKKDSKS